MATLKLKDLEESILCGHIIELPPEPSQIVRIFISSTFGDVVAERNILLQKAYPSLQQWCQRRGFDFQVVDMRWGVRSESAVDHSITALCLREIQTCQQISAGPNFVCFLGQRYGYRPLPAEIEEKEYNILSKCISADESSISLFKNWYKADQNAIPPRYVLQPITTKFQHYDDTDPANKELREKDSKLWMEVFEKLACLLRKAAQKAFDDGLINEETKHKYFMSVTEAEIRAATTVEDVDQRCLCFIRTLNNINDEDPASQTYTDVKENGKPKEEERTLLEDVRNNFIRKYFRQDNIHYYGVEWMEGGVNPSVPEHESYLEQFCKHFVTDIKQKLDKALKSKPWANLFSSELRDEIAHHINFCVSKCVVFCGRKDLLGEINQYVASTHTKPGHKPAVLFGFSGSGKTSVMAMLAKNSRKELGENCVTVLRFVGTSGQSTSVLQVLVSVCQQICHVYKIDVPSKTIWQSYNDLVAFIPVLLQEVSQSETKRPLLILIDSLDQLSDSHSPYSCNWLPKLCPPNVSIIVSSLPNEHNILENLLQSMPDENNYFQVKPLQEGAGKEIFDTWMSRINRQITPKQRKVFKDAFSRCRQPLFLKLAFDQACYWRSYTPISDLDLGDSVRSAIALLYGRLEKIHGETLVSHALGYITAARNGLSEAELEDVLSIDDEVLDDVYQFWSPPNPDMVRIPPLLWTRLKYDLNEYLVTRQANGKSVMALYHRQFIEAAKDRYLKDDTKKARHQVLAEFFLGKWSGVKKTIYLSQRKETYNADRKVAIQPMKFRKIYNMRKFRELPYHLLYAGDDDQLIEHAIGNFGFLNAVVSAASIQSAIEDLNLVLSERQGTELGEEVKLIRDAMRLARPTIEFAAGSTHKDVDKYLGLEFLGRLLQFVDKYPRCIGSLVNGTQDWCNRYRHSVLAPQRGCFPAPGGPLRTTLIGHRGDILDMAINQANMLLVTASRDFTVRIWDLENDDVIHTLQAHSDAVYCVAITNNGKWLVSGAADDSLIVWSLRTGEIIHRLPEIHSYYYLHAPLTTTHDSCRAVSVDNVNISVHDIIEGKRLQTLKGHTNAISCLKVTPDDKYIVSASDDTTVRIWNMDTAQIMHNITDHTNDITCLTVSSKYAVSGSRDKTSLVIDIVSGAIIHKLSSANQLAVYSVCVSPDETYLATGNGHQLTVWNIKDGQLLHTCSGHDSSIDCICVTYDSKYIVTGARDDIMVVWEADTGKMVHSLEGQQAIVSHLALAKYLVVSASLKSQYIKLWNISPEQAKEKRQTFPDKSGIVAVTSNCLYVVYRADNTQDVKVWDVEDGQDKYTLVGHTAEVTCLITTHDDKYVLSGGADKTVILWHIKSGEGMHIFPEQSNAIRHLNLNQSDSHFISVCADNTVSLWSIREKSMVALAPTTKHVTCAALADTNTMIYGTRESVLCVFNTKNNKTQTMKGHKSSIQCLVVSSDGKMLASSALDPFIIIWNIGKRKKLQTITMGKSDVEFDVNHLAFSDDGRFIASAASDKQVKLWRVQDGTLVTSQYVYSNVTAMKIKYYNIIGGTRIGQLLMLQIHYVENEDDDYFEDDISEFGSGFLPRRQTSSVCCSIL
ncbi:NACHT domain- and WD repeat-containing protein 1-like [Ptychodera flava]|uniref:NACHT domain- and WD repeat-containing protein 1-like n=1 Tax=Ptychodera flava TaxID=63121 RepID=UPI00396A5FA5